MIVLITTVFSTKGGCGKTTTSANLGGILAFLGNRDMAEELYPAATSRIESDCQGAGT